MKECDPDWVTQFSDKWSALVRWEVSKKKEDKQTNSFDPEMAQFGGYFWSRVLPNGLSRPGQKGLKNISSVSVPTCWRGDWSHKRQSNWKQKITNIVGREGTMHIWVFLLRGATCDYLPVNWQPLSSPESRHCEGAQTTWGEKILLGKKTF